MRIKTIFAPGVSLSQYIVVAAGRRHKPLRDPAYGAFAPFRVLFHNGHYMPQKFDSALRAALRMTLRGYVSREQRSQREFINGKEKDEAVCQKAHRLVL